MEGSLKENYWLPSPIGGLIAVALAPASMVAGHQTDDEESWALVDFEGWRDFDAAYAAANLGPQVRAVSIGLPEDALRPNMSALEVARLFDQPGLRAQVAAKLANQVGDSSSGWVSGSAWMALRCRCVSRFVGAVGANCV